MAKGGRVRLKVWNKTEIGRLKREYPGTDTRVLARKLGRSLEAVRFKAKRFGLRKTKGYMEALYARARKAASRKKR